MAFDGRIRGSQLQFNEGTEASLAENKNAQQQVNQSIRQSLDGYTISYSYQYHWDANLTTVDRYAGTDNGNAGHEVYRLNAKYKLDPYGSPTWYNGDLYFADAGNHCIRRIRMSSDGYSETWCGKAGIAGNMVGAHRTVCELNTPTDIKFKSDGTAIITDYNNNYIRQVNPSTGIVTNLAGDGTTSNPPADGTDAYGSALGGPIALAIGTDNVILVCAYLAHAIFKIETNNKIYKMAGTYGTPGNTGDTGAATSCTLNYPVTMTYIDSTNSWYVNDNSNARIRVIKTDGTINAFVGYAPYGMYLHRYTLHGKNYQDLFTAQYAGRKITRHINGSTTQTASGLAGDTVSYYIGDGGLANVAKGGVQGGMCMDNQCNILSVDAQQDVVRIFRTGAAVISASMGGDTTGGADNAYLRLTQYKGAV